MRGRGRVIGVETVEVVWLAKFPFLFARIEPIMLLSASKHSLYDLLLAFMYLTQAAQRLETIETTFTN